MGVHFVFSRKIVRDREDDSDLSKTWITIMLLYLNKSDWLELVVADEVLKAC